jgi:hypothetical protein
MSYYNKNKEDFLEITFQANTLDEVYDYVSGAEKEVKHETDDAPEVYPILDSRANIKVPYSNEEWSNPKYEDYKIVRIITEQNAKYESDHLEHCLYKTHLTSILSGEEIVFSIRNHSNTPLVTIAFEPGLYKLNQAFGSKNRPLNAFETAMLEEWKSKLHTKKEINNLIENAKKDILSQDAINFCSYSSGRKHSDLIDYFIENSPIGEETIKRVTNNNPKSPLQALSQNQTLTYEQYNKIFEKCKGSDTILYNLTSNINIGKDLFVTLFNLKPVFCMSSENIKFIDFETIKEKTKNDSDCQITYCNNPSVPSENIRSIIKESEIKLNNRQVKFYEPKFIDNFLKVKEYDVNSVIMLLSRFDDLKIDCIKKMCELYDINYKLGNNKQYYINKIIERVEISCNTLEDYNNLIPNIKNDNIKNLIAIKGFIKTKNIELLTDVEDIKSVDDNLSKQIFETIDNILANKKTNINYASSIKNIDLMQYCFVRSVELNKYTSNDDSIFMPLLNRLTDDSLKDTLAVKLFKTTKHTALLAYIQDESLKETFAIEAFKTTKDTDLLKYIKDESLKDTLVVEAFKTTKNSYLLKYIKD